VKEPKIVLFDLEIIPNLQKALEYWTQLSSKFEIKTMKATVSSICCVGYKIYGEKTTHCINAWDYTSWDKDVNDDYTVCAEIYEVLKDADAVITYNGKRFDWKYLQTRLIYHGLPVLHDIPHIDVLLVVRKNLFNINNKLDTVGKYLTDDRKLSHTGWKLWIDTHNKDPKACELMEKYCKQDVDLLEKVFVTVRPFVKNLPNKNLFRSQKRKLEGTLLCPTCGSEELEGNGWRHTKTRSYQRLRCKTCGSSSRLDANDGNPRAI
jgi:hypothetical protein